MDEKWKELIAIGASVACNCHPCVKFHIDKAKKLNIELGLIQQAVQVGKTVRQGAAGQIDELLETMFDTANAPSECAESRREIVRKGYADIAEGKSGCCCGTADPAKLAEAVGYTQEELQSLPAGANMGLSCGNPTAIAGLKPGQIVLDLGSGGGFDVFIAAKKVGPQGKAIGVDMTPEMLRKARAGMDEFARKTGLNNVEFRLGEIEHLPVADSSIDVVISNCVLNLSPDKPQVWREIARVLKPGGKACIADLALKRPLAEPLRASASALISCVAGAVLIEETVQMAKQAGLTLRQIEEKPSELDVVSDCNDPLYSQVKQMLPKGTKLSDFIVSILITAEKEKL
jgi:AhpD family alkylhydroperoxidase